MRGLQRPDQHWSARRCSMGSLDGPGPRMHNCLGPLSFFALSLLLCSGCEPKSNGAVAPLEAAPQVADSAVPGPGPAAFDAEIARRGFGLTGDQLIEVADAESTRIEDEMRSLARAIDPDRSWQAILADYRLEHRATTPADILAAYEAEIRLARSFLEQSQLVSWLPSPEVTVERTPPDLVASYPYVGYLWSDMLVVTLDAADSADARGIHHDAQIATAVVHEVYPGHRLQNLAAPNRQESETFIEGWAHYGEELVLRHGYYDDRDPEIKLFALRMLLYRAARARLDAMLHGGDISASEAAGHLVDRFAIPRALAEVEVRNRFAAHPGSAGTYLVGKLLIERLRRKVEALEGDRFDLRSFHDRLLSRGGLPVHAVAREVFGVQLFGQPAAHEPDPASAPVDLLSRSIALYGSLRSYADTGTVEAVYGPVNGLLTERHTFRTAYKSPRLFLFDFRKQGDLDRFVIWSDADAFHTWWKATGVKADYERGRGSAAFVAGAQPTLYSLMQTAPLLFANGGLTGTLRELGAMEDQGIETVDGRPCHKLVGTAQTTYGESGKVTNVRRTTVWIDAESLLVRRIFEDTPEGATGVSRKTTTFEPEANPDVADEAFAFDAARAQ